jgi:hypothetical protein
VSNLLARELDANQDQEHVTMCVLYSKKLLDIVSVPRPILQNYLKALIYKALNYHYQIY